MKLLYKRPLCLILCIMLGGFYIFTDRSTTTYVVSLTLAFAFYILSFVFKALLYGREKQLRVALIALSISILASIIFSSIYFPTKYYDKSVSATANVIEADHTDSIYSTITVKTHTIDGNPSSHTVHIRETKELLSGVNAGDEITLTLVLLPLNEEQENGRNPYYLSRGYSSLSYDVSDITITASGKYSLRHHFLEMRSRASDRLRIVSDKDTGDFLAALLMGDRECADPQTDLNFRRGGISHILALSGAHLVILALALNILLKLFGLNHKIRTAVLIPVVLAYMLLTGMSPSVMRSGVMLIISSLLFLLSKKGDPPTTLTLSIFVIVLIQPYAIFDISLWLSAFAVIGLLFLSYVMLSDTRKYGFFASLLKAFVISLLASVFAISASLVISLFSFDSFSTMAVVATLVTSPIITLLIYVALIAMIIGGLVPLNTLLIFLTDTVRWLADVFAAPKIALISSSHIPVIVIAILLIAAFFAFLLFSGKKQAKTTILVITILYISLNVVGAFCSVVTRLDDEVIFSPSASSDLVAIKSDGELAIIASSANKYTTGYAPKLAQSLKSTVLDKYVLTTYSASGIEQILTTVSRIKTDYVYLPTPINAEELGAAEEIKVCLQKYDVTLVFYEIDQAVEIGKARFFLSDRATISAEDSYSAFVLRYEDETIGYFSAKAMTSGSLKVASALNVCDVILVGGSQSSENLTFAVIPEKVKRVYLGGKYAISEYAQEHLNKKGASVKLADTPIKIFD